MFEKEAIRHAFEATIGVECLVKPVEDFTYEELSDNLQEKAYDFQRGAEFGYNFAKEEIDYLNRHWRGEEERKANEWHYCKDELPDHNGQFYVALKGHTETFTLNYDYDEYDESKIVWLDDNDTNFNDEVYAWREKLKAPKEIE